MIAGLCHNRASILPDLPAAAVGKGSVMPIGFTLGENP
jgi:hypothetical protein